jgi:transcriptional regulator with XRE-family HTH domain
MAKPKKPPAAQTQVSGRLNQIEIAERMGIVRQTVAKYLRMPGAPMADADGRFDLQEAGEWILAHQGERESGLDKVRRLKDRKLELELERLELDLQIARREVIPKDEIEPEIAALATELVSLLRQKFEMELPSLYAGRDRIECQQLNGAAVDEVIRRFKEAGGSISAN